jgi:agmatine deiminase
MPAEWEPHAATWIAWPHNRSDWPGKFGPIPWVFGEMIRRIAPGTGSTSERVRLLVNPKTEPEARRVLTAVGADLGQIDFLRFPTDRGWTRDTGPIFVRRDGPPAEAAIARFHFNAWAKYSEWRKDNKIPERAAKQFGYPLHPIRAGKRDVVLEGGSIDVNGRGTLITTEECLLDPAVQTRNPGLSREEIEAVLKDALGVSNVLWLGRGIAGDDTHGHVDDLCRFVDPRTVVLCQEANQRDVNYKPLKENRERLAGMRLEDGTALEIVDLPMPAPLVYRGQRLPASYANFYVANAAVLVPTFNDPNDRVALGILAQVFDDRPVIGIHAVDLVWGLGTIHCLTQQEPAV